MIPPLTQLPGECKKAINEELENGFEASTIDDIYRHSLIALNAYRNSAEIRGLIETLDDAAKYIQRLTDDGYILGQATAARYRTVLAAFKDSTPDKEKET